MVINLVPVDMYLLKFDDEKKYFLSIMVKTYSLNGYSQDTCDTTRSYINY